MEPHEAYAGGPFGRGTEQTGINFGLNVDKSIAYVVD
jgi:hypothetical protein